MSRFSCCLALCLLSLWSRPLAAAGAVPPFDEREVRRDLDELARALAGAEPTAWVYWYTEDAMFVGHGAPVQGRAALLAMAKTMSPLRGMQILPERIEGQGSLAYAFLRGSWLGDPPDEAHRVRVRSLIVLRREADGRWRVAQELLHDDPEVAKAGP